MKRNAVKHTAEEEEKMKNKEEEERRKDKKKKKEEVEEAKMMMILQNKREICSLQPQTTLKYGTSDTFVLNTAFLAFWPKISFVVRTLEAIFTVLCVWDELKICNNPQINN